MQSFQLYLLHTDAKGKILEAPIRLANIENPGDFGLGTTFTFPFAVIEDVIVFDRHHIGVLNDNNFPFSIGHHVGSGKPDDNELIVIRLDKPPVIPEHGKEHDGERWDDDEDDR